MDHSKKEQERAQRKRLLELENWLLDNPALLKDLERLKALSEARKGEFDTLDDAEGEVLEGIRDLGRDLLGLWAHGKERQGFEEKSDQAGVRRHSKKNSASERS